MRRLGGVSATPALSTAKHAWHELRLSLPRVQAILCNPNQTSPRRRASNAARAKPERVLPFENEPHVYPESLRKTLDAHREANRTSLIHKVPEAGSRQPLVLGPPLNATQRHSPSKGPYNAIHLKLARGERQKGRKIGKREKRTEFEGDTRGLTRQWMNEPSAPLSKRLPWLRQLCAESESSRARQCLASERLTSEIFAFHDYILPKPDELAAAEQAATDLRSCIAAIDAATQVELIGSRRTGLATPLSDLDFNITHPSGGSSTGRPQEREQALQLLRSLWIKMSKSRKFITASAFLDRARIPIIVGHHPATNLKFQIQCTGDAFNSMRYAQDCVVEYPTLRPLYLVVRQMLEIRGLNIGSMGGVGSYPLLVMVLAALKFSEGKIGRREAGKQLCFFLDMFAKIDFYTTAISLTPPEYVRKGVPNGTRPGRQRGPSSPVRELGSPALEALSEGDFEGRECFARPGSEPHLMCLPDPSRPGHDLGKQVKLIQDVQALLVKADLKVRESMDIWDTTDRTRGVGIQNRVALLDWCLGADHRIYEDERAALQAWGQNHRPEDPGQAAGVTRKLFERL